MADEQKMKQARAAYAGLCAMLDDLNWNYDKEEENLRIVTATRGDDLPIHLIMEIDADRMLVMLMSQLPFETPEERRAPMAVAVTLANNGLVDGSFDYSFLSGHIFFRLTTCYRECLVGKDLFEYMLACACFTVDEYNDKLYEVSQKDMSFEDILKLIK